LKIEQGKRKAKRERETPKEKTLNSLSIFFKKREKGVVVVVVVIVVMAAVVVVVVDQDQRPRS